MTPVLRRLRQELFPTAADGALSIGLLSLLALAVVGLLRWAFGKAQWAVVQVNATLFAVGRYPLEQQWRLWLLTALLAAATGLSWGLLRAHPRPDRTGLLWPRNDRLAVAVLAAVALLLPWGLGLAPALQLRVQVQVQRAAAQRSSGSRPTAAAAVAPAASGTRPLPAARAHSEVRLRP